MVQEKYAVRLSSEDQEQLRGLIHSGRHSARVINRARILLKPESTEAMGRGVDTRDDGQGKANGASPIPIDGDEGGVR